MKFTVFFSWASDLPNATNRTLIQNALTDSIKAINKNENVQLEVCLDRDTAGVPGSPPIADTIFDKILNSNLFVCDVSIINPEQVGRKTPNPNVLIELGFAVRHLSWDDIVCVCNTEYGAVEELPFDLRHRRIVKYGAKNNEKKQEAKTYLTRILTEILTTRIKLHERFSNIVDINFYDIQSSSNLGKLIKATGKFKEPISREAFVRTATLESIGVERPEKRSALERMSFRNFSKQDSWKDYLADLISDREKLETSPGKAIVKAFGHFENPQYFESMVDFISKNDCTIPIRVCVSGVGSKTIKQVRVELHWNNADHVEIYNEDSLPKKPSKNLMPHLLENNSRSNCLVERFTERTVVSYQFDAIHPGQTVVADEDFFVCSTSSKVCSIEVRIYSDNNQPVVIPMEITFIIEKREMGQLEVANFDE